MTSPTVAMTSDPWQYEDVTSLPLVQKLKNNTWYPGFIRVKSVLLPSCFTPHLEAIRTAPVYEDDIWITSCPKSGTMWMQETVWCIMNIGTAEYEKTEKKASLRHRVPMFEQAGWTAVENDPKGVIKSTLEIVKDLPRPRFIKSHLSYEMLPESHDTVRPKTVHITRNPRDTCVSFYHFAKTFLGYMGSLEDMIELYTNDMVAFGAPFLQTVLGYYNRREQENILFISYEDMKKDLRGNIIKVADFLEKELTSEQLDTLSEHLTFGGMAKDPSANLEEFTKYVIDCHSHIKEDIPEEMKFLRKGVIGDWKNNFDTKAVEKFKLWEEKWLKGTGLEYVFE